MGLHRPSVQHGDPARFRALGDLPTILGVLERSGVVGIAVAVGWWCTRVGVPASWIFAFLVVFGLYALCRNRAVTPPARLMQPAQVLIAMVCTAPLMELDGQTIRSYLLPTVLSVIVMLVVSTVAGMLLARSGHTDPVSAMISTLAGGASAMALMARELHLDVRFVVVTQYLRLTLVVLTLPVFVHLLGGGDNESGNGGSDWWQPDPRPILGAVTVWALTWIFVWITRRFFAVPAPFLLIPIAVTWLLALCGVPQDWLVPHGVVLTLAYAVIGVQAGGTLTVSALRQLAHALPMILTAVTVMVLGTVGAALVIAHFTDISRLDAYLATVPGGIYAVLAFAHESGSSAVVTVGQVLRTLVMIVVGAYLPKLVAGGSRIVSSRRARKRSSAK